MFFKRGKYFNLAAIIALKLLINQRDENSSFWEIVIDL